MRERLHSWPWDYCTGCEEEKPADEAGYPLRDGELIAKAGWAIWGDTGCVCPECQKHGASAISMRQVA